MIARAGDGTFLARPFPGDRDFELARVRAWYSVAFARRKDLAG